MGLMTNEIIPSLPENITNNIIEMLAEVVQRETGPHYAAFDADGTLWDTDAGESFFKFQINSGEIEGLPEDPWAHYHWMKDNVGHEEAFLWLARINKGIQITDVRRWALQAAGQLRPFPVFGGMPLFIESMMKLGIKVYIVTASVQWAVEPLAPLVGLPPSHVIGIRTEVVNGVVTEAAVTPVTWKEGKAKALLERTGGVAPIFCAGNTMGDLALLESSRALRLAISAAPRDSENFETESRLLDIAKSRGWFHCRLRV